MTQIKQGYFWRTIQKRWFLVVFFPVLLSLCSAGLSLYVLQPKYSADTDLLVNEDSSTLSGIQYDSILANQALVQTYQKIIKSPVVEQSVVDTLHLSLNINQLDSMVKVTSPSQSQILDITVTASNETSAVRIANQFAQSFQTRVQSLMHTQTVQMIAPAVARVDARPVRPHKILNTLVGGFIGLLLGVGLAFLIESFDNRLHVEEDVEEMIGYPVFGTIYDYVSKTEGK